MESQQCHTTRLLYCTTGVLLRKLQLDPKLQDISHIIVDEVCADFFLVIFLYKITVCFVFRKHDISEYIEPEVYYLHELCQSCSNLFHGIVLQEQWIWSIHDVLFSAVWETYPACERTVSRARTLVFICICPTADVLSASTCSLRLRLVLGTSFARQAPNPMMPYGRPGRVAKLVTMLAVLALIWSTMLWYGLLQDGTLHVGNRLPVWITAGWHTSCR